jgi:hypothetical protein
LPLADWLLNPFSLWNSLSQKLQKCGFSTSDVSFNGKAIIIGPGFRVDVILRENLILISR